MLLAESDGSMLACLESAGGSKDAAALPGPVPGLGWLAAWEAGRPGKDASTEGGGMMVGAEDCLSTPGPTTSEAASLGCIRLPTIPVTMSIAASSCCSDATILYAALPRLLAMLAILLCDKGASKLFRLGCRGASSEAGSEVASTGLCAAARFCCWTGKSLEIAVGVMASAVAVPPRAASVRGDRCVGEKSSRGTPFCPC
mmetsp:Transcript_45130/g.107323  ORF Transcript_45130/g.107323 Transcript_45130/m.107323 type:complete len:200 (-) Transcript_45130:1461-2060(-)